MAEDYKYEEIETPTGDFWQPKNAGDFIEGVLKAKRDGQFGVVYDIETDKGDVMTVPSKTVIATKMQMVKEGDRVKIEYKGEVKSKASGRMYQDYSVSIAKK